MPRPKEFTVTLTARDRAKLTKVVTSGTHPARMITRARVLLDPGVYFAINTGLGAVGGHNGVADRATLERGVGHRRSRRRAGPGGRCGCWSGRSR